MSRFESVKDCIVRYQKRHNKPATEVEIGDLFYLIEREWLRTHVEPFTDAEYFTDGVTVCIKPLNFIETPVSYLEESGFVHNVLTRYGYAEIDNLYNDIIKDPIIGKHKGTEVTKISLAELKEAGRLYEGYCFNKQKYFPIEVVAAGIVSISGKRLSVDQINILLFLCQCEAAYQDNDILFQEYVNLKDDMIHFISELPEEAPELNERAWKIVREVVASYANLPLTQLKNIVKTSNAWKVHSEYPLYRAWSHVIRERYIQEAQIRRVKESRQLGLKLHKNNEDVFAIHDLADCVFDKLITPNYALLLNEVYSEPDVVFGSGDIIVYDNLLSCAGMPMLPRFTVIKSDCGALRMETLWHTNTLPKVIMQKSAEFYSSLDYVKDLLPRGYYETAITEWISK